MGKKRKKKIANRAIPKALTLNQAARLWASGIDFGSGQTNRPYEKIMLVNRCISNLAEEIAGLEIMITDDREKRIEDGPLYELLEQPNPRCDGDTFWAETVSYLMLDGEVYWVTINYDMKLRPKEIAVIGKSQMEPQINDDGELVGWKYNYGRGKILALPTIDVVQIRLFSPYEKWRGLSPLKAAKLKLSHNFKSDIFYDSALDNGCDFGGFLTADEITDEQEKQIITALEKRHQGVSKAKRLAILAGGLSYIQTAKSMIDMQMLELMSFSNKQICIALKTPPPIVGIIDDANYKMETSLKIYFNGAIQPLAKRLGKIFTLNYAKRFGKYWVWFNTRQHPTAQIMMRETIADGLKLCEKGATFNDVNKLMDWGLPEYEWGNTWYKPLTLVRVDEPLDLGPALDEGKIYSTQEKDRFDNHEHLAKEAMEIIKISVWKKWKASWTKLEGKFAKAMRGYFYRQRREMLKRLETETMSKVLNEDLIMRILFDLNEENKKLKTIIEPLIAEAIAFGGKQIFDELGVGEQFLLTDPAVINVMRMRVPKLVAINTVTRKRVAQSLADGMEKGETVAELAQRIRNDFSFSSTRAMTIARTETAGAVSGGRHIGMQKSGIRKKAWLSARDGHVRDTHRAADARYTANPIPIDTPFEVGEAMLMHPGDPAGPAKEVINCACVELPITETKPITEMLTEYSQKTFLKWSKQNG